MYQRSKVLFIYLAILVLTVQLLNAQVSHTGDSLLRELSGAKPDTNKVWLYIRLGQQYEGHAPDSALTLYEAARSLSEELGYTRGLISYYTNATYVYNMKGMYDTALVLNLESVEVARRFGNPERLAACLGNVAASYTQLDQHEKAIDIYLQIIPLYEKLPPSVNRGVIYENLCVLYSSVNQPSKAKYYAKRGIAIYKEFKHSSGLASALNDLSIAHMNLKEYDSATTCLNEANAIATRTNNQYAQMATSLNLATVSIDVGKFAAVKDYCIRALALAEALNDRVSQAIALRGLAIHYFYSNEANRADQFATQSLNLASEVRAIKEIGKAYGVLAEIATLRRDFQGHNFYSMKSDSIRALLLNETIVKNVQNIEAKYESAKKNQEILDLQQAARIKDLSIERNKLITAVLIGSFVALLSISLLARYNYKQKKKILTQENQVQEARIAQLESEKQVLAGEAVIKGQEEERGRLAKDLHDGLGGMLSGVKFSLSIMKSNMVLDAQNHVAFERALDMLDHSMSELRRVAHNMMPEVLLKFGLAEALRSYCEGLRDAKVFEISYQSVNMDERLPEQQEIFIFRIVQELINNVIKHAQATTVLVQLANHVDELTLTVEDNGVGFDPAESGSSVSAGLTSVKSRVDYLKGRLEIQSTRGQGTSVYVFIPR